MTSKREKACLLCFIVEVCSVRNVSVHCIWLFLVVLTLITFWEPAVQTFPFYPSSVRIGIKTQAKPNIWKWVNVSFGCWVHLLLQVYSYGRISEVMCIFFFHTVIRKEFWNADLIKNTTCIVIDIKCNLLARKVTDQSLDSFVIIVLCKNTALKRRQMNSVDNLLGHDDSSREWFKEGRVKSI